MRTTAWWVGGRSSSRSTRRGARRRRGPAPRRRRAWASVALGALVVVAEGLAVGGHGHQPPSAPAWSTDRVDDAPRLVGLAEGEGLGQVAVVDDEVDARGRVGPGGTSGRGGRCHGRRWARRASPARSSPPVVALERPDGAELARRQDREPDALLGQHREHALADRRLRQPHALGRAAEAVAEVGEAPPHLGAQVAVVAEREDRVAVGLGDGPPGPAVGLDDAARRRRGGAPRATTAASGPTLNDRRSRTFTTCPSTSTSVIGR